MNFNQTITLSPKVISQQVSGETVILDLDSECFFGLDTVGSRIWHLIGDGADLPTIYNTLLDEYEVEEAQLQSDMEALLADASERGLIILGDASQTTS